MLHVSWVLFAFVPSVSHYLGGILDPSPPCEIIGRKTASPFRRSLDSAILLSHNLQFLLRSHMATTTTNSIAYSNRCSADREANVSTVATWTTHPRTRFPSATISRY